MILIFITTTLSYFKHFLSAWHHSVFEVHLTHFLLQVTIKHFSQELQFSFSGQ